jgi:hypothetical protein
VDLQNYERARADAARAIALQPGGPAGYSIRALDYRQGQYADATVEATKAIANGSGGQDESTRPDLVP